MEFAFRPPKNSACCPADMVCYYRIYESDDGTLKWLYLRHHRTEYVDGAEKIPVKGKCGGMSGDAVTGEEAEEITGLHMPAAMDRLRELAHESR